MYKHRFLLIILIVCCSAIAFGQDKQNCAASEELILDRGICDETIDWKDSAFDRLLPQIFRAVKVPAGISVDFSEKSATSPDFTPESFILRDILNKIVTVQPQYHWTVENGVLNLSPIYDYAVLDLRLRSFKLENGTAGDALKQLEETPEFGNHIRESQLRMEDTPIHGFGRTEESNRFSIELTEPSIREVLNAIVSKNGGGTWMYGENVSSNKQNTYRLGIYR